MTPGYDDRVYYAAGKTPAVKRSSGTPAGDRKNRRNFCALKRKNFWRDAKAAAQAGDPFNPIEWVLQNCSWKSYLASRGGQEDWAKMWGTERQDWRGNVIHAPPQTQETLEILGQALIHIYTKHAQPEEWLDARRFFHPTREGREGFDLPEETDPDRRKRTGEHGPPTEQEVHQAQAAVARLQQLQDSALEEKEFEQAAEEVNQTPDSQTFPDPPSAGTAAGSQAAAPVGPAQLLAQLVAEAAAKEGTLEGAEDQVRARNTTRAASPLLPPRPRWAEASPGLLDWDVRDPVDGRIQAFWERAAARKPEQDAWQRRVRSFVAALIPWPWPVLEQFGSLFIGLGLPDSDMDLCIEVPLRNHLPGDSLLKHLGSILEKRAHEGNQVSRVLDASGDFFKYLPFPELGLPAPSLRPPFLILGPPNPRDMPSRAGKFQFPGFPRRPVSQGACFFLGGVRRQANTPSSSISKGGRWTSLGHIPTSTVAFGFPS